MFLFPYREEGALCLGYNLLLWFVSTPLNKPNDPVFLYLKGDSFVPLTRNLATPVFNGSLLAIGCVPAKYGWSSFRRGGATTYFRRTGDTETLRAHGDWRSDVHRDYIALPSSARAHVATVLLDGEH